jgi:hypothetical protein
MRVAGAEGESSTVVRTGEERMPARHAVDQDILGATEQRFHLPGHVRLQFREFLHLRLLDGFRTCCRFRFLRGDPRRPGSHYGHEGQQPPHSNTSHPRTIGPRGLDRKTCTIQVKFFGQDRPRASAALSSWLA